MTGAHRRPLVPLLISQRVDLAPPFAERRDALDQRWASFLAAAGFLAVPVPNRAEAAEALALAVAAAGVVLSGGNDLASLGGTVPERDATEAALLAWARKAGRPVLGICRGMQILLAGYGAELGPVTGHAGTSHDVILTASPARDGAEAGTGSGAGSGEAVRMQVNSYHNFAARTLPAPLTLLARAADGGIEAFAHPHEPVAGLMWHPERDSPPRERDLALFRQFFHHGSLRLVP